MLEFGILGPLEVRRNGRVVPLHGRKQRALLALLLLRANEVVSRERLIDELWSDEPPETATNTLQVHVSQLRKALDVTKKAPRARKAQADKPTTAPATKPAAVPVTAPSSR